uniref:Uncharacterized protein n=1 Tax=Anguilla anguilla TaxID=7936 RepID=A0A0E9SSJ2_ANGAN
MPFLCACFKGSFFVLILTSYLRLGTGAVYLLLCCLKQNEMYDKGGCLIFHS